MNTKSSLHASLSEIEVEMHQQHLEQLLLHLLLEKFTEGDDIISGSSHEGHVEVSFYFLH